MTNAEGELTSGQSATVWWFSFGILLAIILPVIGSLISAVFFPDVRFAQVPFHSLVETAGGLMAVAIAGILLVEAPRREERGHYLPMACALIVMGILDAIHAAVPPGKSFVWLHSTATFLGGVIFASVWLVPKASPSRFQFALPTIAFFTAILFGIVSCFSENLPAMVVDGHFTPLAQGLNILGGVAFLVAAVFFAVRFFRLGSREDWLFAVHTALFGAAGILFELSTLWDIAWWWWHLLRLGAYFAALAVALKAYVDAELGVLILNRELTETNQRLDETIARRTTELETSEQRYALAVAGSSDGIWDWNVETDATYYSNRLLELCGYAEGEIPFEFSEFQSHLHPEDYDETMERVRLHLEEKVPYDVEYRLRCKDGSYRWFRARGQAVWNDDGKPTRMAGSITDIHDRKETATALEQEKHLLNTLLENLPEPIYFKDVDGRFLRASATLAKLLGADNAREIEGKRDEDYLSQEYSARARQEELEVMRTEEPLLGREEHPVFPDGTTATVLTTKIPLRDAQGEVVGTFGISHDVTAIKQAEKRFRMVVEATPNPVILIDDSGRIQLANRAVSEVFGFSPDELRNLPAEKLVPESFRKDRLEECESLLKDSEPDRGLRGHELPAKRKDGTEFPAEVRLRTIPTENGNIVLASVLDLTPHKEAEKALRLGKEAAEQANQAKSDFLANMSHEIRTPMNAVIGMSELLLDTDLTGVQRDYLSIVLESAESLLAIINEILDFSKIEAGKLELESKDFDLFEEVGDAVKSLALRAHSKGLELTLHIDPELPQFVKGDPVRLRQILINLIGNSIKFTPHGDVFIDVLSNPEVTLDPSEVGLTVKVRDTGIGISQEKLATIFAPFEQADISTTREFGGTGLGLTITARLVAAMQGKIWVESEKGEGSTFCFTAVFATGQPPEDADPPEPPDLGQVPVLVVDDNPLNRRILREMLESWGMPVTTVEGGRQAIEHLNEVVAERGSPPLLLSDVNMPEMDGFDLVTSLRKMSLLRETVVIMLTSGGRTGDIARCQELNVQSHMMKPVKQSELLEAILVAVGKDRSITSAVEPIPEYGPIPSLKVLLAEDGKANQRLARALLEKWGHTVTIAENGQLAVEEWQKDAFDLILMDVQMPEMDGFEATQAIRKIESVSGQHIPIIAMTARAMKGDREKCLDVGMDEYVSKPVRKSDLLAAIAPFFAEPSKPSPAEESGHGARHGDSKSGLVNWAAALVLVEGDHELLGEITQDCLTEIPEMMQKLSSALDEENASEAQRFAHTIKAAGRTFEIASLQEAAGSVETAAAEQDLTKAREQYPQLSSVVENVLQELRAGFPEL